MILPRGLEIIEPEKWKGINDSVVLNIAPIYMISTYGRIYIMLELILICHKIYFTEKINILLYL